MITISQFNFVPQLTPAQKGFLGWINLQVQIDDKILGNFNCIGVWANKLTDEEPVRLTWPAKKLNTSYNYFWELVDVELIKEIKRRAVEEIEKVGFQKGAPVRQNKAPVGQI